MRRMILAAVAASGSSAVWAHHGVSSYRMDVVQTVAGVVAKWDFGSPHTWLTLNVTAPDGTASWEIEGAPPRWMSSQGFAPESLGVGETVTITYHPHRRMNNAGILMEVRRANGDVLKVNRPAALGGP